jgi:cellulose biosynthesis protein BcsQ
VKSVALFSVKGGVGKSTAAVNLAHAAATGGGRRTLLWDLDSQGATTWLLRSAANPATRARAALRGDMPLADLVVATAWPQLWVLPADRSLRRLEGDLAEADRPKAIRRHLKALAGRFDRILIDCPPGLSELADHLFRAVDLLVAPYLPTPLSARAEAMLSAELKRMGKDAPPVLAFWNMVDSRRGLHRETVASLPSRPAIPYSAAIEAVAVEQQPIGALKPRSPAARAYASLWSAIEMALMRG